MPNASDMLREDHRKVKELFRKFEQTENNTERKAIVEAALVELDVHTRLEEEIFYPAVRREARGDDTEELMDEAEEEHHVVDVLAKEIMKLQPDDPAYAAKFTVLYENVEHHIEEEESEMLPKADELGPERLEELGTEMQERKNRLMKSNGANGSRASTRSSSAKRTRTGAPARSRSGSSASGSGKSKSRTK